MQSNQFYSSQQGLFFDPKYSTYIRPADGQVTVNCNNSQQTNTCHPKKDI